MPTGGPSHDLGDGVGHGLERQIGAQRHGDLGEPKQRPAMARGVGRRALGRDGLDVRPRRASGRDGRRRRAVGAGPLERLRRVQLRAAMAEQDEAVVPRRARPVQCRVHRRHRPRLDVRRTQEPRPDVGRMPARARAHQEQPAAAQALHRCLDGARVGQHSAQLGGLGRHRLGHHARHGRQFTSTGTHLTDTPDWCRSFYHGRGSPAGRSQGHADAHRKRPRRHRTGRRARRRARAPLRRGRAVLLGDRSQGHHPRRERRLRPGQRVRARRADRPAPQHHPPHGHAALRVPAALGLPRARRAHRRIREEPREGRRLLLGARRCRARRRRLPVGADQTGQRALRRREGALRRAARRGAADRGPDRARPQAGHRGVDGHAEGSARGEGVRELRRVHAARARGGAAPPPRLARPHPAVLGSAGGGPAAADTAASCAGSATPARPCTSSCAISSPSSTSTSG